LKSAIEKIYLYPGDYVFGDKNIRLHTLLGSCVAVTLWHPEKKIGGMCHIALPSHSNRSNDNDGYNGRYAEDAIELFKASIIKNKTSISEYEVKIFGGSLMSDSKNKESIGNTNILVTTKLLQKEGATILSRDVGGVGHRKIVFNIDTGHVWVRHDLKKT